MSKSETTKFLVAFSPALRFVARSETGKARRAISTKVKEIANPGPMRLYLCDCALERARGRPIEQQASLLQRAGPGAGILGSSSAVHKVEGEASLRIKLASGLTPDGGIKSKGCFSGKSVSIERLPASRKHCKLIKG